MKTPTCTICRSKIYPYCPNPDEIIWMCENEECVFPFGEDPQTLKEVCTLQPKYSPVSLIKQVHLVQEGKLSNACEANQGEPLAESEELESQILTSMCKLNDVLTHPSKKRGVSPAFHERLDENSNDDLFNQIFFSQQNDSEMAKVDFSIGSEPVFQVEKVCRPQVSNLSPSYTDLDSASDHISACVSEDGNISEIDADVEMDEEQSEYSMNYQYNFNWTQKDESHYGDSNCWPTIS